MTSRSITLPTPTLPANFAPCNATGTPTSGLATYTLCYEDDCRGLEKRVRFEAASAATALEIARGEAGGRWALLMCGGEILCRLEREAVGSSEYWVVAPPQMAN
jgi:hypothetical protein